MGLKKKIIAGLFAGLAAASFSFGEEAASESPAKIIWRNNFVFYGDNTEFFEPFRLRETILGQQFKSYLNAATGEKTSLSAGLFVDHRSGFDTNTNVYPMLAFGYQTSESQGVLGTLQPLKRHGLLEPMESTTLELTRPIEYGFQWRQIGGPIQADLFLDWQHLLTGASREIFDYGGSAKLLLLEGFSLGVQAHCYHVGGASFPGVVRNNVAGGLGLAVESKLPITGQSSLEIFGFGSNDSARKDYPGPGAGSGIYAKGTISPLKGWKLFGIAWIGKDFMSEEGDSNYNSFGYDGVYYKSDRNYEEAGISYTAAMDPGVIFDFELRSHWIENEWAHSLRFTAAAPFDLEIELKQKQVHREGAKTAKQDEQQEYIDKGFE